MAAPRIYPRALWQPLPEDETQPKRDRSDGCLVILHSQVGSYDLNDFFGRSSIKVESHMQFKKTGKPEQMVGNDRTADANYRANYRALSAETADDGNPDTDPWNAHQCEEIALWLAWLHKTEDLPLRLARSWNDSGVGYHSQFDEWTIAEGIGKTCPGRVRIKQVPGIIARAIQIAEGKELDAAEKAWLEGELDAIKASLAAVPKNTWSTKVPGAEDSGGDPLSALAVQGATFKRAGAAAAVTLTQEQLDALRVSIGKDLAALIPTPAQIARAVHVDTARTWSA